MYVCLCVYTLTNIHWKDDLISNIYRTHSHTRTLPLSLKYLKVLDLCRYLFPLHTHTLAYIQNNLFIVRYLWKVNKDYDLGRTEAFQVVATPRIAVILAKRIPLHLLLVFAKSQTPSYSLPYTYKYTYIHVRSDFVIVYPWSDFVIVYQWWKRDSVERESISFYLYFDVD